MLFISLIKPSVGLFFLKDGKTRKKAGLIYIGTILLSFILFIIFSPEPNTSTTPRSNEVVTENDAGQIEIDKSYLKNKSIKKWIEKSNKESYIENLIEGTWFAEYSILGINNFEPKLERYNKKITKQGETTFTYFFEDGIFPKFEHIFTNYSTANTPDDRYKQAGPYKVDKEKLTLTVLENLSDIKNVEYEVLFISKGVLIIKDMSSIIVFTKQGELENSDIEDFISYFRTKSLEEIVKITQNYSSNILASENALAIEVSNLQKFSLIRNDMYPAEVRNAVNSFIKQYSIISDSLLASQFHNILNKNEYIPTNEKLPVVESYILKFEELHPVILNTIVSREAANMNKSNIQKVYETELSKYNKMYKLYSLYGTGTEYLMKSAAIDAIKSAMNDPNSFDFVEGWATDKFTKSGWVYYIKYRGKNAFGGTVLEVKNITLRYSPENKIYRAVNVY